MNNQLIKNNNKTLTTHKYSRRHLFITATDTEAGKTYVSCALVKALVDHDYNVAVYKPISAGCEEVYHINSYLQLINSDAQQLQQVANCKQTIEEINPIVFKAAIAPHIAAKKCQQSIDLKKINLGYQQVCKHHSDFVICEGAGGWRLPIGNELFLSDFVKSSQQRVILVVNIKLGCLNHARLTYESIVNDGLTCLAWVANYPEATTDSLSYIQDNIVELKTLLPIPMLAAFPFEKDLSKAASQINIDILLLKDSV